jgi:hypothetical protein
MACKSNITGDFLIWVVALTDAVTGAVLAGILFPLPGYSHLPPNIRLIHAVPQKRH